MTPDYLSGPEAEAAALFANVLPTVVTIFTASRAVTPDGGQDERGIGSGVLISPECHVLTAAHVIEGADAILVKTHDGNLHAAELLYSESGADIALIKLVVPEPELAHARLGDSDRLPVGQCLFVIGAPFGLELLFRRAHQRLPRVRPPL